MQAEAQVAKHEKIGGGILSQRRDFSQQRNKASSFKPHLLRLPESPPAATYALSVHYLCARLGGGHQKLNQGCPPPPYWDGSVTFRNDECVAYHRPSSVFIVVPGSFQSQVFSSCWQDISVGVLTQSGHCAPGGAKVLVQVHDHFDLRQPPPQPLFESLPCLTRQP